MLLYSNKMLTAVMLLFLLLPFTLSSATVCYGVPFLNINLSPSLLPSQPMFARKNGFEHLKVRFMSMSAFVVPSITSYVHPPEPFLKPSVVPAPSPIQGPVAGPAVVSQRRHRHHFRHGKITHVVSPSPSPLTDLIIIVIPHDIFG